MQNRILHIRKAAYYNNFLYKNLHLFLYQEFDILLQQCHFLIPRYIFDIKNTFLDIKNKKMNIKIYYYLPKQLQGINYHCLQNMFHKTSDQFIKQ